MKAAVFYGARDFRVEDIEEPQMEATDVLVKVNICGICGSDLHSYQQGLFSRPGWVMGHEISGEVTAVGKKVKDIKVQDRVVPMNSDTFHGCGQCFWCQRGQPQWCPSVKVKPCGECELCTSGQFWLCKKVRRHQNIGYGRNGGYAEYVIIPEATLDQNVFELPEGVSFDEGAFVEPLQGALHWVLLAEPKPIDTAVVLGLGTIGLLVMQVLKQYVSKVIVSEVSPKRLSLAKELGADAVIDASKEDPLAKVIELTGTGRSFSGKGGACADLVMECSGAKIALEQALEMTRSGGRIVLVGLFKNPVTIDMNRIIHKQLNLISSFSKGKPSKSEETAQAIGLISNGKVKTKPLVSHQFPLEQINQAFEIQTKPDESVKVLIKP